MGTQIKGHLAQGTDAGTKISRDSVFDQVAQSFNANGAAMDKKQVMHIVTTLAPQARGLLAKRTLKLINCALVSTAL